MCIGIPMQVEQIKLGRALCRDIDGNSRWIDIQLVEPVTTDQWLLVFLEAAREVISQERAEQVNRALKAMSAVMQGQGFDEALFADLTEQEPQLPPHLQAQFDQQKQNN